MVRWQRFVSAMYVCVADSFRIKRLPVNQKQQVHRFALRQIVEQGSQGGTDKGKRGIALKDKEQGKVFFGISAKMGLAIGLVSIVIAGISFYIATDVNKALTIETVLNKNWVLAQKMTKSIGESNLASLLEQGREIYDSLSEEECANPVDPVYQSHYDVLRTSKYKTILAKLDRAVYIPKYMWADLRFKDEKRGRYIHLMHTGGRKNGKYGIGYWEKDDDSVDSFFDYLNRSTKNDRMEFLPEWVGDLSDHLPESVRYVPYIYDHLLAIARQHISNRFSTLYPIHSTETGEVIGYLSIGEYYENYQNFHRAFALVFVFVFVPYFIVATIAVRAFVRRDIVRPIQQLAKAAVEYGKDEDRQGSGSSFGQVHIPSNDELLLLRDSMADMEDSLARYMDNLKEMTARQERLKAEMDMSAQIQMGMLPQELEDSGAERDFAISATIHPAKSVGGDFYDFFIIDDDRIGIVMADVSGKGIPAALFMMISKIILGNAARRGTSVEDIMYRANRQLCANNPEMLFVTIWFGIYQVKERMVRYVNAGHDYPALYRCREGKFSLVEAENDFLVGFDPDTEYHERILKLEPGDKLFLYTDGIPEAHNPAEELYGDERMLAALDRCADRTQEEFLEAFDAEVRGFIGEADQFDDMTTLILELNPHA